MDNERGEAKFWLEPRLELAMNSGLSKHGFWLLVDNNEYFLSFAQFPWFQTAPVGAILNVERLHAGHFYWPELDVDLELDSIRAPEHYPLVAREELR